MLKHKFATMLLLISLVIWLAACGANNEEKGKVQQPDPPPVSHVEPQPEPPHNDPEEQEVQDEADTDEDEQASADDDIVEVAYYMNSNYDLKPIDAETDERIVLLTFDDGPKDEAMVTTMLDVLDKHDAKAIFFVNGHRVVTNPELLIEIHERGHIIGNHTWQHLNLTEHPNDIIDEEIEKVQHIVEEIIGEKPVFFRPPFGAGNAYVREKVAEEGMLYMHWSNGSLDWEFITLDKVLESILDQLRPGSNILMHELQHTVDGLDTILTTLTEEGYAFVDPRAIHLVPGNPKAEDQSSIQ